MLVDLWEQILNYLDREDLLNILKSKIFVSSDRLICKMCSYRRQIHISDEIYTLEYIYNNSLGSYYLKSSTCGIYLNGICDHCSKIRGKLKMTQSAFNFHNFKDYLQIEQLLESKNRKKTLSPVPKSLLQDRLTVQYT